MTEAQIKMMEKLGLSKEDFEPINKEELLEEAYLKCEYNSINGGINMIYRLMKKKIQREGLTEENKNLLDVYLLGNRITQSQYEELMRLAN